MSATNSLPIRCALIRCCCWGPIIVHKRKTKKTRSHVSRVWHRDRDAGITGSTSRKPGGVIRTPVAGEVKVDSRRNCLKQVRTSLAKRITHNPRPIASLCRSPFTQGLGGWLALIWGCHTPDRRWGREHLPRPYSLKTKKQILLNVMDREPVMWLSILLFHNKSRGLNMNSVFANFQLTLSKGQNGANIPRRYTYLFFLTSHFPVI